MPLGGLVVSAAGSHLVAKFNTSLTTLNFPDSLRLTLESVSLGIISGAAAAVFPAYRVVRLDPYEAIRKGE